MAQPRPRYDGYGRPLPELAPAGQEPLYDRPTNVQQRHNLLAELEAQWRAVLRRGQHAEVTLRFRVQDGWMQSQVEVGVVHYRRYEVEDH